MKKPIQGNGLALTKSLYGIAPTKGNLVNLTPIDNPLDRPPSIIPGVKYPITDREREIIFYVWLHCLKLEGRI